MTTLTLVDKRESKSLWNYTLAPGWTVAEVDVFRLCLIKYGFGRWTDIMNSHYLIGKTTAQMCNQLQRMVGQQSIGEFFGLHIDPKNIFEVNKLKEGQRKNGCLINMGHNPTKELVMKKRKENQEKFGLSTEDIDKVEIPILDEKDMSKNCLAGIKAKIERMRLIDREMKRVRREYAVKNGLPIPEDCIENDRKNDVNQSNSDDDVQLDGNEEDSKTVKPKKAKTPKRKAVVSKAKKSSNSKSKKRKNSEDVYGDDEEDLDDSFGDES